MNKRFFIFAFMFMIFMLIMIIGCLVSYYLLDITPQDIGGKLAGFLGFSLLTGLIIFAISCLIIGAILNLIFWIIKDEPYLWLNIIIDYINNFL